MTLGVDHNRNRGNFRGDILLMWAWMGANGS
jgi:hypothetical protein